MNHLKTNPIGIDAVISYAQQALERLESEWGVTLDIYPRCYPKITDGLKTIDWFKGNVDYELLNVAEGNKFFFTAEEDMAQVGNGYFTTTISLFCIVNLKQVKPDISHRADAEIWADVNNVLRQVPYFGLSERIVTGFDKVFGRYDYDQENDMQPYHCFRMDLPVLEFKLDQEENCFI